MFDTLNFAQDILVQEINSANRAEFQNLLPSNRQHLTDGWDEDGSVAPINQTVLSALDIALLLTVTGQPIYHTSPGPLGEVVINLRNGGKSAELLIYPGDRRTFVSALME